MKREAMVQSTCTECGREFQARKRSVAKGEGRLCGLICSAKHRGAKALRRTGSDHHGWKGGRSVHDGYVTVALGDGRFEREHIVVAERAIGHALPAKATVHHVNDNRSDNRNRNLVICQDQGYHMLLHALARVQRAGGRPFLDAICHKCRAVKPLTEFSRTTQRGKSRHASKCNPCAATWQRERRSQLLQETA